jgi:hypothetical protein
VRTCAFLGAVALCTLIMVTGQCASVLLHSFDDPAVWKPNADGGNAPEVTADTQTARSGGAVRLKYTDKPPEWGNLTGPCTVPADALALRLWLYKHSAAPGAALHIWLFEPDGDCWVQRVPLPGGVELSALAPGWHEITMPIGGFAFQPRGKQTREMTGVNRMLIGCNFADLEVTLDDMTWDTGSAGVPRELPRGAVSAPEDGPGGRAAILDLGEHVPAGVRTGHSPAALAAALRAGGWGVTLLQAGDLADPKLLTAVNFDVVVLPYGPAFPAEARGAFCAYLKQGGSFLSTDGYAFDMPVEWTDKGWSTLSTDITAADMNRPAAAPAQAINTRTGKSGDSMSFAPAQIPVFSPQFRLERATNIEVAPEAAPLLGETKVSYSLQRPLVGYSACALTGLNSPVFPDVYRRWVPLLNAYDDRGELRGAALAMCLNYAGEYRSSSWAFSGLTDGTDLFLGTPERTALLLQVMASLRARTYLCTPATDLACYEVGETATLSVQVANFGRQPQRRSVRVLAAGRELMACEADFAAGQIQSVSAFLPVTAALGDLVPVVFEMCEGGRVVDRVETALCVRSPQVLASGPKVGWKDNMLTVDGKPTFVAGSNQTGMMYYSPTENPWTWDRDFRSMSERGYHALRILHFSPFAKDGYKGVGAHAPLDLKNRPERLVRQMDAIVQLAQKHRVAIFLTLHDWVPLGLTEEELEAEKDWCRFWAERYREVPGIFYDVQNEPTVDVPDRPDIVALWNAFLVQRYGTDEALAAAWAPTAPGGKLPNVPLPAVGTDWSDTRGADRKRFETELLNRWAKANVEGVKAGDPDALVCVGYLQNMSSADKVLGVRETDFSNCHFYGSIAALAREFKLIDRRFVGKGLTLGEFGAREAHTARNQGSSVVPVVESIRHFRAYEHYVVGMGAAFMCNWCWKDFDEMEFPWGLMQRCSYVAKPWVHTLEQGTVLLADHAPVYEAPQVYLLAPDRNRVGPRFNELLAGLFRAIDLLMEQRVNFGVVNEEDLDKLPAQARALLWPLPYCPADETFAQVRNWVEAGGTLYFSGDVGFDASRKPTRAARWAELGLAEQRAASPFETPAERWQMAPQEAAVGRGKVLWAPYPLELKAQAGDSGVYRRVLEIAGIARIALEPESAPVRALSVPTAGGGRLFTLHNAGSAATTVTLAAQDQCKSRVAVQLQPDGCAFIACGADGTVQAAESDGELALDGAIVARGDGSFSLCALDGKDLRQTRQLVVLPTQCANLDLSGLAHLNGAQVLMGQPAHLASTGDAFGGKLSFAAGSGVCAAVTPDAPDELAQKVWDRLTLGERREGAR